MAKQKTGAPADRYPNIVFVEVVESASNTLTFQQIQTGYGSLDKVGWLLSRLEYYMSPSVINLVTASDDSLKIALVKSNLISEVNLQSAAVIDLLELMIKSDSASGFETNNMPIVRDFSNLPGGGQLVLPYPIYLAVEGTSLASAATVSARLFFTEIPLQDQEWMELVQQTRLLT